MTEQVKPDSLTMTKDELLAIITHAIQELKKPDAETAAKLAIERERRESDMRAMVELAKTQELETRRRQETCSHRKENGERSVGGQIHSDGKIHPICLRCQKQFTPIDPPQELLSTGVTTGGFSFEAGM